MTNKDFESLKLFGEYDQKTLAALWGYKSYDAIRRGIVTPANSNVIILFVTEDKVSYATQYRDQLVGNKLYASGETSHMNDKRLASNLNGGKDTIYLFYRSVHHTPFVYYGEVKLIKYIEKTSEPSHFEFLIESLNRGANMKFFGFKISNPAAGKVVNDVKQGKDDIVIEQLNQLEEDLKIGNFVFITLGGDQVPWQKGLIGLASITKPPFEKGYDSHNPRNFKLGLKMELVLSEVIKRNEFIPYIDAYDAAGIGPNTKGEQNQAIKALTEKQAVSILRAMVEREPQLLDKVKALFDQAFTDKILGKLSILVLNSLAYGEIAPSVSSEDGSGTSTAVGCTGKNIILYGVPGAGKSHTIETEYCNDDEHMERVVFHPDYTYSDFVGQIMPKIKEGTDKLEYRFVAGPFTKIMRKAYDNPSESFYLVIEEINRGNAPAIFGDVFQLLDRNDDGISTYGITNQDIADIVYSGIAFDKKVKIPANLTIIATMNTADQSVFTLDTAFKRRWDMRMIPNEVGKCKFADVKILDTEVTWATFVTVINDLVLSENSDLTSTEDKRIGAYFVKRKDIELLNGEYNPAFAEKVLMYLWNDVFKFSRDTVFNEKYNALDKLIKGFETERFGVFNIEFKIETEGNESDES